MIRSIQWRIATAYILLIVVTMGTVTAYLLTFVRGTYLENLGGQLKDEAALVGRAATPHFTTSQAGGPIQELARDLGRLTGARITLITPDGMVLADTWEDPLTMENHARRPEVAAALATGSGAATRYSTTAREDLIYRAVSVRQDDGGPPLGVARVAVPLTEVQAALRHILVVVVGSGVGVTLLAALVALVIARAQTRSLRGIAQAARGIAEGDLGSRAAVSSRDELGEVGRVFNTMAGRLQRMVADLAAERDKLQAVLDTMSDGVVVTSADGRVLLANAAAEQLTGVMLQQPEPVRLMDTVRDHVLKELVEGCLSTGTLQQRETALLRTRRYARVIAAPMTGDGRSVLLVLQDRTEAHRVEVTRREFVANVSHELRTPISAVKALVETLRGGAAQDPQVADDFLRRVEVEVDRMARLVSELLELSRLERGEARLSFAPVSARRLLEEALERFRPLAEGKGQALELQTPAELPAVRADAERVHQVLANLIANALKFTPSGGHITLLAAARNGNVVIEVRDTGPGIPAEHLPHIFERFYKADRSRRGEGAGLGLAIAKHIVQAHGGEIGVRSREGEGATFWFTLPQVATPAT